MAVGVAAAVWGGAATGRWWGWPALVGVGCLIAAGVGVGSRRTSILVAVLVVLATVAGALSSSRDRAVIAFETPAGEIAQTVRLTTDPRAEDHGWWALALADPPEPGRPSAIPMLLSFDAAPHAAAGEVLQVHGKRTSRSGTARGDPYSGVVKVDTFEPWTHRQAPWWWAGNAVRRRALESLAGGGPSRSLLAGFLVGETAAVPAADVEAMRRSGLSHLVAVSGSNVALFLMLALVAAGPLAAGPRRRAVVGLGAIAVFLVATRWEPSVVRASFMASLVLVGRIGGWALDGATALAVTVVGVVVVWSEMATDVGFTLSVLATLGVLVGGRFRIVTLPRSFGTVLGATMGAQVAVAPVLLVNFGSIPLMAPLTNLLAAPVVAASTVIATLGVGLASDVVISVASWGSAFVLALARLGAGWPQLGPGGTAVAVAVIGIAAIPRLRPLAAALASALAAAALLGLTSSIPSPGAVVLDVGQGDSILVVGGDGSSMLVDGGPDPAVLEARLGEYGATSFDLVVLTHVHADHAMGLEAVVGRRAIGEMWLPGPPHETPASRRVAALAGAAGVPTRVAPVGETFYLDELAVDVLAPVRRYAAPNDQSVVLLVTGPGGRTLLLTGDIETFAQADLEGVTADVLKVPHQGGATSDLDWLQAVGADLAIVSVGPNDFGHPSDDVIAALEKSGARVVRTDMDGDVVVPLG